MASTTKPKILLLGEIEHEKARNSWSSLSTLGDLITPTSTNRADFLSECRSGRLNGIKAAYRTFNSVSITGKIEGEVCEALSKAGLKFLSHNGAGYDQCNIPDCTAAGIRVSNVPTAVDAATADTAIFLLLGALRGFNMPIASLRSGDWRGKQAPPLGHDPEGKVLGIVGMGGIGRDLKKKAEALGMRVQYHNRRKMEEEQAGGAKYVGFEELLRTSDVISLNVPLNESTRHMLSHSQFAQMKSSAVIINTSRGAVIDEDALVTALKDGSIASAGLDVYEEEPKIHPGLVENEKVMLLPHLGTWTQETQTEMELWNIDNVRSALESGKLKSPVAEQKDMR